MTPADMLRVLRGLATDDILTADQRREMDEGCLGWDYCTSPGSHSKMGGFGNDGAVFETYFGTVTGVQVVIATNSPSPSPLESVVTNAVFSATVQ